MNSPLIIAFIFLVVAALIVGFIFAIANLLVRIVIAATPKIPSDSHYQQVKALMLSLP